MCLLGSPIPHSVKICPKLSNSTHSIIYLCQGRCRLRFWLSLQCIWEYYDGAVAFLWGICVINYLCADNTNFFFCINHFLIYLILLAVRARLITNLTKFVSTCKYIEISDEHTCVINYERFSDVLCFDLWNLTICYSVTELSSLDIS